MLGSKRRFVILRDHGRLLPKPGFLAQMSQTAATVNSWKDRGWYEKARYGQPRKSIRCPGPDLNRDRRPTATRPVPLTCTLRTGQDGAGTPGSKHSEAAMEVPRSGSVQLAVVLRFVDIATDALAEAREEIDALNVYPVPDGDTGTNMYLTVSAARDAIREVTGGDPDAALGTALATLGRGALLGARGNSGVILSEMLGAIARRLARAEAGERNAEVMADALVRAADASYAAVGEPVEGTILTVIRAAADAAAERAGDPQGPARDVFAAAAAGAREALAHTPEQLPALKDAGVVDAGGRDLSVILDAAETVLTGRRPVPVKTPIGSHTIPIPLTSGSRQARVGDLSPDGPSYEVMYLLDAEDEGIPTLRARLAGLGDSLVVVGGEGLWNVHVHVDDVGAAIEAGIDAGRPHRVRVTHFAEQVDQARQRAAARAGRRIVAVAAGPGLAAASREGGAVVPEGRPR